MDVVSLHRRSVQEFLDRVHAVRADQWDGETPCTDWNVRELVNHVVGEDLWTVPMMGGATIEEVGDRFDGDVLGDDPKTTADRAGAAAVSAMTEPGAVDRTVHLSFGDTPAEEYAWQLCADHLIHGWDLAAATGGATTLDPELVGEVGRWFAAREEMYRAAGVIGPHVPESNETPQSKLLAAFGRDEHWPRNT